MGVPRIERQFQATYNTLIYIVIWLPGTDWGMVLFAGKKRGCADKRRADLSNYPPFPPLQEMPDTVAARLSSIVICCSALAAPAQALTNTI
jgi:hypothetical protein